MAPSITTNQCEIGYSPLGDNSHNRDVAVPHKGLAGVRDSLTELFSGRDLQFKGKGLFDTLKKLIDPRKEGFFYQNLTSEGAKIGTIDYKETVHNIKHMVKCLKIDYAKDGVMLTAAKCVGAFFGSLLFALCGVLKVGARALKIAVISLPFLAFWTAIGLGGWKIAFGCIALAGIAIGVSTIGQISISFGTLALGLVASHIIGHIRKANADSLEKETARLAKKETARLAQLPFVTIPPASSSATGSPVKLAPDVPASNPNHEQTSNSTPEKCIADQIILLNLDNK